MCAPTQALCVCAPRRPGCLSGRAPTRGFRCGPQATDWGMRPLGHFGSGMQAAGTLIRVPAHPEFQLWAPSPLILVCTSRASGERWGCFSSVHCPGAEGVIGLSLHPIKSYQLTEIFQRVRKMLGRIHTFSPKTDQFLSDTLPPKGAKLLGRRF